MEADKPETVTVETETTDAPAALAPVQETAETTAADVLLGQEDVDESTCNDNTAAEGETTAARTDGGEHETPIATDVGATVIDTVVSEEDAEEEDSNILPERQRDIGFQKKIPI